MRTSAKSPFGISVLASSLVTLLVLGCGQQQQAQIPASEERGFAESPASSPIRLKLSFSKSPALNEKVTMTIILSSSADADNTTDQVKFTTARGGIFPAPYPAEAVLVTGNLTWKGDLKAGVPISLSAVVVFKEAGKWAIEGNAHKVIDDKNS